MPEPDLGAAGRAVNNLGEYAPAMLFNCINGYAVARVALNVSWQQFPVPIVRVDHAPFHENVRTEDINLFELLPLFRLNREDGGFYIDKACRGKRTGRPLRRIYGTIFRRAQFAGDSDRSRLLPKPAYLREPVFGHALDGT
jgi:3-polyprenyl-4-hydroxybenzoate decarboxylase